MWFAHNHHASKTFKNGILYIALANGKEVLRLDTAKASGVSIIKDKALKQPADRKCNVF